mgnify:CR=1 FL=1
MPGVVLPDGTKVISEERDAEKAAWIEREFKKKHQSQHHKPQRTVLHLSTTANSKLGGPPTPVDMIGKTVSKPQAKTKTKRQIADDFVSSLKESAPPQFNPLFDNTQSPGKTKPTTPPPPITQGSLVAKELPIFWPHPSVEAKLSALTDSPKVIDLWVMQKEWKKLLEQKKDAERTIKFAADARRRRYHKTRCPRGQKYTDEELDVADEKANAARTWVVELNRQKNVKKQH